MKFRFKKEYSFSIHHSSSAARRPFTPHKGYRHHSSAMGFQSSSYLFDRPVRVEDVLEDVLRDDYVESFISKSLSLQVFTSIFFTRR